MKTKNYYYHLLGAISSAILPLVITVSCGDSESGNGASDPTNPIDGSETSPGLTKQEEYSIRQNGILQIHPYDYDRSASYGGNDSDIISNLMNGDLFRIKSVGKAEYEANAKGKLVLKTATQAHYVLEYAKSIIITKHDGTKQIYDNDKHEIEGSNPQKISSVFRTSADPKSINNPSFQKDLLKAKSFQISVKDDVYWVDHNGKKTKYKVVAEDFWYSFVRTKLLDPAYRWANGGSQKIDKEMVKDKKVTSRFSETATWPNEYLFHMFGASSTKLLNEADSIKEIDGVKYFTLHATDKTKGADFDKLFLGQFIYSDLFPAAPSQYIKEVLASKTTSEFGATGLAKNMGIYEYGFSRDKMLFAGAYYISLADATTKLQIYKKNTEFVDKDFVKANNNIKSVKIEYKKMEANKFRDISYQNFLSGDIDKLAYSQLSNTQKQDKEIQENLSFVGQLQKSNLLMSTGLVTIPGAHFKTKKIKDKDGKETIVPDLTKSDPSKYFFSDNYAKLMWGANKKTLAAGTAKTSSNFFDGYGLRFRSILTSAVNWKNYVNVILTEDIAVPWLSSLAPDAAIGGSDQNTSPIKTLRHATDDANTVILLDKKINIVDTSNPTKDAKSIAGKLKLSERFKSSIYDKAKKEMKILLDQFYADNGLAPNEKIQWYFFHGSIYSPTVKYQAGYDNLVKLIRGLDNRLDVSLKTTNDRKVRSSWWWRTARSQIYFTGWGYDYEGIGSGFDGRSHNGFLTLIGGFSIYAQKKSSATFPEFTKLSKALKDDIEKGLFFVPTHSKEKDGSFKKKNIDLTKMDKWKDIDNKNLYNVLSGWRLLKDGESDEYVEVDESTEFAKFFFRYQNSHTNKELLDLAKEYITIASTTLPIIWGGDKNALNTSVPTKLIVSKDLIRPVSPQGIAKVQDITFKKSN